VAIPSRAWWGACLAASLLACASTPKAQQGIGGSGRPDDAAPVVSEGDTSDADASKPVSPVTETFLPFPEPDLEVREERAVSPWPYRWEDPVTPGGGRAASPSGQGTGSTRSASGFDSPTGGPANPGPDDRPRTQR
jgi:hypothetical protein